MPLPQLRQSSAAVRVVLSLAVTVALQSTWPVTPVSLDGGAVEVWTLLGRMAADALHELFSSANSQGKEYQIGAKLILGDSSGPAPQ